MTTPATTTDVEADNENKRPTKEKEITVVHDQGFFRHDTGDMYDGFFEAKKKDRSVKMHGPGVYTTAEGDCYTGNWELDRFGSSGEVVIAYIDGSRYEGLIKDWSYATRGRYFYPDESVLRGEFAENCPTGKLTLTDPNGHTWLGKAEQGFGWFEPVNHYYEFLETTRDQNRVRRRHSKAAPEIAKAPPPSTTKTSRKKTK